MSIPGTRVEFPLGCTYVVRGETGYIKADEDCVPQFYRLNSLDDEIQPLADVRNKAAGSKYSVYPVEKPVLSSGHHLWYRIHASMTSMILIGGNSLDDRISSFKAFHKSSGSPQTVPMDVLSIAAYEDKYLTQRDSQFVIFQPGLKINFAEPGGIRLIITDTRGKPDFFKVRGTEDTKVDVETSPNDRLKPYGLKRVSAEPGRWEFKVLDSSAHAIAIIVDGIEVPLVRWILLHKKLRGTTDLDATAWELRSLEDDDKGSKEESAEEPSWGAATIATVSAVAALGGAAVTVLAYNALSKSRRF